MEGSLSYESLLEILRCPACADETDPEPGRLDLVADTWYVCRDCERKYPIRDRIPVLLIQEGTKHRDTPLSELDEH
jgi:uncharacterized protein YbaR (Trm112 family)